MNDYGVVNVLNGTGEVALVPGEQLRNWVHEYTKLIVDLGAGDGRYAYRLARRNPDCFILAIDANMHNMTDSAYRASRKPSRGGLPNIIYVHASVEALPEALNSMANEIHLLYPWGGLLRAVLLPDAAVLAGIARISYPGGLLKLAVNISVMRPTTLARFGLPVIDTAYVDGVLIPAYQAAGLVAQSWQWGTSSMATSWAGRLGNGQGVRQLTLEAQVSQGLGLDQKRTVVGATR